MPKIICELENASLEINGIKFVPLEDGTGVISEKDVSEGHAAIFLSIPGYRASTQVEKKETPAERKARLAAEKDAADKEAAEKAATEKEAAQTVSAPEAPDSVGDEQEGSGEAEVF